MLWALLSKIWVGWLDVLVFVQPSTVVAWQRRRFRDHWARLAGGEPGRPPVAKAVQDLVREMSSANPRGGSPRSVGELAKLGIHVAKATVEKYMVRPKKPSSPTGVPAPSVSPAQPEQSGAFRRDPQPPSAPTERAAHRPGGAAG